MPVRSPDIFWAAYAQLQGFPPSIEVDADGQVTYVWADRRALLPHLQAFAEGALVPAARYGKTLRALADERRRALRRRAALARG